MRFIHITDTHVGSTPTYGLSGKPALATLEALVEAINNLPFQPDFVLHSGDVTDDGKIESYRLARPILEKIKAPIYYVIGNHDRPTTMLPTLLDNQPTGERYDYEIEIGGFKMIVLDTRGPVDPAGTITSEQFAHLREVCRPDGPPLIIAMHHQPVLLDAHWLDQKWDNGLSMPLDRAREFRDTIAPAKNRLRGVFFGHVHRGFQVFQEGILYCSAPSAYNQYESWPGMRQPVASDELPGFGVVTVTPEYTLVRQYTFGRPL
jgi:Icc protein